MSKEELNEFKVSAIFQNRLITALKGEKESHIELANEIGISKDILIRALNTGVIPGTRSLIKLADYTDESIDYLIGLIDTTFYAKSLDYINFQDRLNELIIHNHTKKGTIASTIGISRSSFNSWETHNYIPSLEVLFQLANHFKVSLDYLLARTNRESYKEKNP